MAPAVPQQAKVEGPRVLVVGADSAGAVRALYTCSGFGSGPVVDVHTNLIMGDRIRDLVLTSTAPGAATFSFTLQYNTSTTDSKEVCIFVTDATGKSLVKLNVPVRPAR